ncbi:LacI family DNA-binding transcriptional regulator [Octadecabacter sp. G9-8]|uniref:LacI family DNA-binding transcriptional regulator n=1 Tax=Octadecabacter dasysiphoniae TaxID=2909341 RepID=A0ABS9CUJ3_9RHOB|nr:LacI family DNA-binding transcriptional regulator [Octadecabacter dasysiphoniae]MCF2869866.1 LacI family DNA-binding transcriptional regulator [Octadecabacter dasysiphoniae]
MMEYALMDVREVMLRPTTKDLAKAAGVSRATVDRVLNGREGVKKRTVDRVNDAIQELGFVRNIQAANLARSQRYRFVFALPRSGDLFLEEIVRHIDEANETFATDLVWCDVVHIDENDPHSISAFLATLDPNETTGVAIMAPESPQVRDAIFRLQERGVAALPFIADQSTMEEHWVGTDHHAAGATAATLIGRFCPAPEGSVLVISESMRSRDSLERRIGFDAEMNQHSPGLRPLPSLETYGDEERAERVIYNSVINNPDLVGVYVLSSEARVPLTILNENMNTDHLIKISHERTPFTEAALRNGSLDAVIAQDPGHLVRSAVRKLKAITDKRVATGSQERIRVEVLLRTNI